MRPCSTSGSISTSVTAASNSVADTVDSRVLDDPRHGDHVIAAHDERPRFALRPRNLGVHENVLNLLTPSCQPVARSPPAYLKAFHAGPDTPRAPAHLAVEIDRAALEPE